MDPSAADRELTTTRRIPAPPAKVWAALTDPRVLATWWGPDGFTNTFQVCELRPGGAWRFVMHGPDGRDYPNESRFVELDAPRRWAIEHTSPPRFRLTMTLSAVAGGTEIHWIQAFADAADCAKLRHICVPANEQNLDRLTAALARLP